VDYWLVTELKFVTNQTNYSTVTDVVSSAEGSVAERVAAQHDGGIDY